MRPRAGRDRVRRGGTRRRRLAPCSPGSGVPRRAQPGATWPRERAPASHLRFVGPGVTAPSKSRSRTCSTTSAKPPMCPRAAAPRRAQRSFRARAAALDRTSYAPPRAAAHRAAPSPRTERLGAAASMPTSCRENGTRFRSCSATIARTIPAFGRRLAIGGRSRSASLNRTRTGSPRASRRTGGAGYARGHCSRGRHSRSSEAGVASRTHGEHAAARGAIRHRRSFGPVGRSRSSTSPRPRHTVIGPATRGAISAS